MYTATFGSQGWLVTTSDGFYLWDGQGPATLQKTKWPTVLQGTLSPFPADDLPRTMASDGNTAVFSMADLATQQYYYLGSCDMGGAAVQVATFRGSDTTLQSPPQVLFFDGRWYALAAFSSSPSAPAVGRIYWSSDGTSFTTSYNPPDEAPIATFAVFNYQGSTPAIAVCCLQKKPTFRYIKISDQSVINSINDLPGFDPSKSGFFRLSWWDSLNKLSFQGSSTTGPIQLWGQDTSASIGNFVPATGWSGSHLGPLLDWDGDTLMAPDPANKRWLMSSDLYTWTPKDDAGVFSPDSQLLSIVGRPPCWPSCDTGSDCNEKDGKCAAKPPSSPSVSSQIVKNLLWLIIAGAVLVVLLIVGIFMLRSKHKADIPELEVVH